MRDHRHHLPKQSINSATCNAIYVFGEAALLPVDSSKNAQIYLEGPAELSEAIIDAFDDACDLDAD